MDQITPWLTDFYLKKDLVGTVATTLVREFPHLQDLMIPGSDPIKFRPEGSMRDQLNRRIAEYRRDKEGEAIEIWKNKHQNARAVINQNKANRVIRLVKETAVLVVDPGLTDVLLEHNMNYIKGSWATVPHDDPSIWDMMTATRMARRRQAHASRPTEFLHSWPLLADFQHMVREGKIQYDKDMPALRVHFMTDRRVANAMEVIRKATSKPGLKLLRHLTMVPADNLKDAERHCALVGLPLACKENLLQWCVINEEPTTEGTVLRLVPHDTSIFVGECQMEVWTYGQVLCRTSPGHGLTLSDGIDAMIVANMLFDRKEELKCVGTWRFAQEIIYKYPIATMYQVPRAVGGGRKQTLINSLL